METIVRDIESGLDSLRGHLAAIRDARPQPSGPVLTHLNEPWARALAELPGTYTLVLANFELLILEACKSKDLQAAVDAFVSSAESPQPGYWSAGVVSQGAADTAVKLGILQPSERDRLLGKRVWDRSPFSIDDCVSDLTESIDFLAELLPRLRSHLSAV